MEYRWEILVVIYLFLGGLGAGLFVFSALLGLPKIEKYQPLARAAAIIAPFPVALGAGLLIFDLGNPLRFWRLFSTIEWTSPMSIGSWLLVLFTMVSGIHMLLWLFPDRPDRLRWGKLNIPLPNPDTRHTIRRLLAAVGLPMGIGVAIYTGVLLGAIPARPFWNTPMVATLFMFSALSSGAAVLLLVATARARKTPPEQYQAECRFLYTADIGIILLEVFTVIPFFLHNALSTASQAQSLKLVLGGPFTGLFWIGFVLIGLALPFLIEVIDLLPMIAGKKGGPHHRILGYLSAVMVLVGGFLLRYVFVFAGQVSYFG